MSSASATTTDAATTAAATTDTAAATTTDTTAATTTAAAPTAATTAATTTTTAATTTATTTDAATTTDTAAATTTDTATTTTTAATTTTTAVDTKSVVTSDTPIAFSNIAETIELLKSITLVITSGGPLNTYESLLKIATLVNTFVLKTADNQPSLNIFTNIDSFIKTIIPSSQSFDQIIKSLNNTTPEALYILNIVGLTNLPSYVSLIQIEKFINTSGVKEQMRKMNVNIDTLIKFFNEDADVVKFMSNLTKMRDILNALSPLKVKC